MDEGDEPAMGADTRMQVDELQARGLETAQLFLQVAHFQGHVMHTFATGLQKAGDARPFGNRHQQLQKARARRECGDAHALIVKVRLDRLVKPDESVMLDRLIKIANNDANVMQLESTER